MSRFPPPANAHATTGEFIQNFFTGAFDGDLLSIVVLAIIALIILRFIAARWVFVLAKQIAVFGGLAFAVWYGAYGDGAIGDRYGAGAATAFAVVAGLIVTVLFFIMLYMFFLRRGREKDAIKAGMSPEEARQYAYGKGAATMEKKGRSSMRVGAGALSGQGLPVHYQKTGTAKATGAGGGPGGGSARGSGAVANPQGSAGAAVHPEAEVSRLEETLKKMNVLGATKEQNLMTVSVLILVAQFGVFTSRTVAAPSAHVGMALFAIFVVAAAIFVMTAYQDKMKGIVHFVYATIFASFMSVLLLVYWQGNTLGVVLSPDFYFASDGLIAMITGVAFSTLLTKGGG